MKSVESSVRAATSACVSFRAICGAIASVVLLTIPANINAAAKDVNVEQPIDVQVVNETPVPVESVDDALREPYGRHGVVSMEGGTNFTSLELPIPAGKRLVVETISFEAQVPAGQGVIIRTSFGPGDNPVVVPLSPQFAMPWVSGTGTRYMGTHAMRFLVDAPADADGALNFNFIRDSTVDNCSLLVAVMGYLVDL